MGNIPWTQGSIHPRWCRISSTKSSTMMMRRMMIMITIMIVFCWRVNNTLCCYFPLEGGTVCLFSRFLWDSPVGISAATQGAIWIFLLLTLMCIRKVCIHGESIRPPSQYGAAELRLQNWWGLGSRLTTTQRWLYEKKFGIAILKLT